MRRLLAIRPLAAAAPALASMLACASAAPSRQPSPPPVAAAAPNGALAPQAPQGGAAARRPRPYAQVVTARARTDRGGITVHRIDERHLLEVPDSLLHRDFQFVTRLAGVPSGLGGLVFAGATVQSRLVRWERQGERMLLRVIQTEAFSDDSLPIATSVASNNVGAILAAFPPAAYTSDSASVVVDVTDFLSGDTPALSGLSAAQRRLFQVRRLDPARSFVSSMRSYPMNLEIRQTQTFDASEPPSDQNTGSLTLDVRHSIVLLPKVPMRPRYADERMGFYSHSRVNYGLDEQKAASQRFIRRWRLEPNDPAAYARGELVEPVKPIVFYIDPATPARWRPYVRRGVESWAPVFESAGFRNAVQAKDAPTPQQDPDWDPEDIRYSVVRWTASLVRNAQGLSTWDPRSGEIVQSGVIWYHNHMRSYRNRLLIETAAANPPARTLEIPESLMGETMAQVIAHEVGHAIGLPHNMVASSSYPVDSLRSPTFARTYGVSPTIMDYARQNYVAQPGDGLQPTDFIRRLGPHDRFVINWGYRVIPTAATPDAERATLDGWIANQPGPMPYRYVADALTGIDARSQTEDIGDDPIRATAYGLANMRRLMPNLVRWTTKPGEDHTELAELYLESLQSWARYLNHVVALVGGLRVDAKTAEESGDVYAVMPRARQAAAVRFVGEHAFETPAWLAPSEVTARIGPQAYSLLSAQSAVVTAMLDVRRLGRLADSEKLAASSYSPSEYLPDLRRALWGSSLAGERPDANRRALQRLYLQRLDALINGPAGGPAQGAAGAGSATPPSVFLTMPDVARSDLPAIARSELRMLRAQSRAASSSGSGVVRAHWADVAERIDRILDPRS